MRNLYWIYEAYYGHILTREVVRRLAGATTEVGLLGCEIVLT
jgi:hypothetical protein